MTRNKLYSMLLSLVVAFGLWLYVVTNVSQEDDVTFYNVPVVMEGEAALTEENLMITSMSANTVSLNLTGARSDLSKLDSSKLAAKVDLSGIKEDTGFPRRLQHWTYYDLQTKIENKAKEHGIRVVKIDPRCTSQRCSRCGHIDPKNRPSQSQFCCTACDFRANADFNASQNISTKGIDKIIAKTLRAKSE